MSSQGSEDKEAIDKCMTEKGIKGVQELLMKRIDDWKTVQLNFAVIGRSGVGKSSFINAVRDLTAEDDGAAEVGVTETTFEIKPYPHPSYPTVIYWDVPGVGTQSWPRDTYLKDIDFEKYDFYLILTAGRFLEDDVWLAQEAQKNGKKCYFLRTKIDIDVENEKRDRPKTFNRDTTVDKIRTYCKQEVAKMNKAGSFKDTPIFLISSAMKCRQDFDFQLLKEKLIEDSSALKKGTILFVLSGRTKNLLEQKKEMLQTRIFQVAVLSAIGGAIPVPGLSFVIDMGIIKKELQIYREQFGLDNQTLTYIEAVSKTDSTKWQVARELIQAYPIPVTEEFLEQAFKQGASEMVEDAISMIPVVGSPVAAGISYGVTCFTLRKLLNETFDSGLRLLEIINEAVKEEAGLD